MDATIISFRRGRRSQRMNQFLLEVAGVETKEAAVKLVGRKVVWTSPGQRPKAIGGTITACHGRNGVLRARFTRGLPGEAIRNKVKVLG